ncbi:hypothetical protein PybrP1_010994 [[Pythium] brassicae (nom. inval.)]|nr:hypothetical protein PybrP1_010994 [[Pythium] brassicae (nom. inval.)]
MAMATTTDSFKRFPLRRRSLSEPNLAAADIAAAISSSVLCGSPNSSHSAVRVRIRYQDEALRLRAQANSRQLIQSALDDSNQLSNSARIAKKALKYRKILDRMRDIDLSDPAFNASEFLGVDWCKTIIISDSAADEAEAAERKAVAATAAAAEASSS